MKLLIRLQLFEAGERRVYSGTEGKHAQDPGQQKGHFRSLPFQPVGLLQVTYPP